MNLYLFFKKRNNRKSEFDSSLAKTDPSKQISQAQVI